MKHKRTERCVVKNKMKLQKLAMFPKQTNDAKACGISLCNKGLGLIAPAQFYIHNNERFSYCGLGRTRIENIF